MRLHELYSLLAPIDRAALIAYYVTAPRLLRELTDDTDEPPNLDSARRTIDNVDTQA